MLYITGIGSGKVDIIPHRNSRQQARSWILHQPDFLAGFWSVFLEPKKDFLHSVEKHKLLPWILLIWDPGPSIDWLAHPSISPFLLASLALCHVSQPRFGLIHQDLENLE